MTFECMVKAGLLLLMMLLALVAGSVLADPPGAVYSPELRDQLKAGLQSQSADYQPRTRHLLDDGAPVYTNRLILEDSTYLLQHAHNPVNWYPWGPEAFAAAKRENKPVFLSIGYSTCHWCHVMERESFEDEGVAEYLNTHFIAIKVDRERRPDIDAIYMAAVQVTGQRGGWPLSSFLTPAGKSFFGATYFPREQFLALLQKAVKLWNEDQPALLKQADEISARAQRYLDQASTAGELASAAPALAVKRLSERHAETEKSVGGGGFGQAPKFPHEAEYLFLIDNARRHANASLTELIRFDLRAMAQGGIYDQVGGGFHRYSTDNQWLVPHFEKMLYNQAQMSRVYLQAASLIGEGEFERIARQTLDYVLRDLRAPGGGFYSATDADSEGSEGRFFLWTPAQVRVELSQPDADLAIELFNISEIGNFEGSNILHLSAPIGDSTPPGQSRDEFLQTVDRIRERLYRAREHRIHPGRDDKIITSWNAMMIMALAEAAALQGGEAYGQAALDCGQFLWSNGRQQNGQLWRASLNGRSSVAAVQEDYAWLADAYISLYDLSQDPLWLERARELLETMQTLFWDHAKGGYFMSAVDKAGNAMPGNFALAIGRPKDIIDGAVPSGNAVALHALARLARRPGDRGAFVKIDEQANALLATFAPAINRSPSAFPTFLLAASVLADGQSGPLQYAAHGGVAVNAQVRDKQLTVNITIQPGWHINSNQPLTDNLVPTVLRASEDNASTVLSEVSYPSPVRKSLGFQSEELALYQGSIKLEATLTPGVELPGAMSRLTLQLQACDDEVCLPPERMALQVPLFYRSLLK